MKTLRTKILALSLLSLLMAPSAQAGYINFGLGVSDIDQPNTDLSVGFELDVGLHLSDYLSIGLATQIYTKEVTDDSNFSVIPSTIKLTYYPTGSTLSGPFLSAGIGGAREELSTKKGSGMLTYTEVEFVAGGQIGYNFQFANRWSVGPKASYYYVFNDNDGYSFWSVLAAFTWSWN